MSDIKFRLICSPRRRRIALRLSEDGVIEVHCPIGTDENAVGRLLADNPGLISRLHKMIPRKKIPELKEGCLLFLLGKKYPLHLSHRLKIFDHAFIIPNGTQESLRQSIISLYRELANAIIKQRISILQSKCTVSPTKIRISSANTRWGSCSANKTVSFSWKLIQCPLESVDYVIVHELSHIKEMNHSARFWKHVSAVIPDYREQRLKLKNFAKSLPDWD